MDVPPIKETANNPWEHVVPERLGKYPLQSLIGRGSMGILYKSADPHIKRPVALKIIRRDLLVDNDAENFSARFRIEAQAAGSLHHPGIVAVYEYGEEGDYAFIAMEYIEGRSLRDWFEKKVPFSTGHVVNILTQLLEALQYAHDKGVWHRDVKPANILITDKLQVKVTDFGIARVESSMLTQVGAIMGTPGFIAPEMYLGDTFDARIDVFAAGVVLYQLLAGIPPFVGTAEKVMFKVCYEAPLPPSVAGRTPSLQPFDAVVLKALARRPEDRYASAAQFLSALKQAQANLVGPDETIIRPNPAAFGLTRESASQPPSTNTLLGAGWDMDELAAIEAQLARVLGPIAKVMVRRAAKDSPDSLALTQALAGKITNLADRDAFLRGAGVTEAAPRAKVASTSKGTMPPQPPMAPAVLTPADVTHASQLLASMIGPIAPVLAKRAATPGSSRQEFISTLAGYLHNETERERFLSAVDRR